MGTYTDYSVENNDNKPNSNFSDHVKILKYYDTFANYFLPKIHMLLLTSMVTKLLEHFIKKSCKRQAKKEFRIEKVTKRKDDRLYVKWKGYENLFNSWINMKDMV